MLTRRNTVDEREGNYSAAFKTKISKRSQDDWALSSLFALMLEMQKDVRGFKAIETVTSKHIKSHDVDIKKIRKDITEITSQTREIPSIKRRLEMSSQVDIVHSFELHRQAQLRNNYTIMGIPPDVNEDLMEIISTICSLFEIEFTSNCVQFAKRVKNSRSHIIIVHFATPDIKDTMLKLKKGY